VRAIKKLPIFYVSNKVNQNTRISYMTKSRKLRAYGVLSEAISGSEGKEWKVTLIKPGLSANRTFYPESVLAAAVDLFEGARAFIDHPPMDERVSLPERSVKDIAGWFEDVQFVPGEGLQARFLVSEGQPWLKNMMIDAFKRGNPDLCGFSIYAEGDSKLERQDGKALWWVEKLTGVASVDVVTSPAAGGRFLELIESQEDSKEEELMELENLTLEELEKANPDLVAQIKSEAEKVARESLQAEADKKKDEEEEKAEKMKAGAKAKDSDEDEEDKEDAKKAKDKYEIPKEYKESVKNLERQFQEMTSRAILAEALSKADLPKPVEEKIREDLSGKILTEDEVAKVIDRESKVLAEIAEEIPLKGAGRVKVGDSEVNKYHKAMDGMLSGEMVDGISPFKSLHQAYATVKGISPWEVDPLELIAESQGYTSRKNLVESMSTSTWAQILGDSITRSLLRRYRLPELNEWREIVDVVPIKDFRTQRRVRMGGLGNLASVSEGADYQEFSSISDEEATYAVSKRGNLYALTEEVIANDDLGAVRRIPMEMADAAKETLFEFVFDFLDSNPTLYDGTALFASGHGNLGSSALSDSTLTTAKQAMRAQAKYGASSQYLRIKPKWLIVPVELEATALHLRNDESEFHVGYTADSTVLQGRANNVHRGTFDIIVVDYWTDANNWYLAADKRFLPIIEVGFLGGKEEPELMTQDQPNVGSVFTADKITYKIRHIYGGTVVDYRGLYGAVVT
jgi:hypothetical protein